MLVLWLRLLFCDGSGTRRVALKPLGLSMNPHGEHSIPDEDSFEHRDLRSIRTEPAAARLSRWSAWRGDHRRVDVLHRHTGMVGAVLRPAHAPKAMCVNTILEQWPGLAVDAHCAVRVAG